MHPRCHIFFKIPSSPCPQNSKPWTILLENQSGSQLTCADTFHPWAAALLGSIPSCQAHQAPPAAPDGLWSQKSSALSWSPLLKAVYRKAPSTVFRTLLPIHQSLNAASPTPAWTFRCLNPCACLLDLSQESWQVWDEWFACPPRAQGGTTDHRPPAAQSPSHAISDRASRRKRWASNPN